MLLFELAEYLNYHGQFNSQVLSTHHILTSTLSNNTDLYEFDFYENKEAIKNGQSRDTDNIRHKSHRTRTDGKTTTKTKNKAKNKKQTNTNWKDEQHEPTKKPGVKRCSRHVTHIIKAGTNSLDNGANKKNLRKR